MEKNFKYFIYDAFLNEEDYKKIQKVHGSVEYFLKYTDLYKFLQTEEMACCKEIDFFINNLERIFNEHFDTTNYYYTIFGSYYRKGDYLLCHDDRIDNRKYAFTYYLEDYSSGSLILYNNACDTEINRLEVKKNRLVIFEVSDVSWHEVGFCEVNGRRAFTGWINHKSIVHESNCSGLSVYDFQIPEDIEYIDFELLFEESSLIQFPGLEYDFAYNHKKESGPFYMRKVCELKLIQPIGLNISEYSMIYFKAYEFQDFNYILLNDYTNSLTQDDILDIIILECEESNQEDCFKYLNEDGRPQFTLPLLGKVLYAIKRNKMKYFIENASKKNFKMVHMIYKKNKTN